MLIRMHVMLALMMGAATASPPPPEGHEASPLDGRATASDFDADDSQPASDVALDDDVDDDDNITLLAKSRPLARGTRVSAQAKRDCFALHEQYGFPPVPLHSQLWQTYPEADKVHWDNIKQATAKRSRSVSPQGHAGACALNPKNQERKARAVLKIGGVARLEDRRG
jgi:hypothetical protein